MKISIVTSHMTAGLAEADEPELFLISATGRGILVGSPIGERICRSSKCSLKQVFARRQQF